MGWDKPKRHRSAKRTGFRSFGDPTEFERHRRRSRLKSWLVFVPVWAGTALLGTAYGAGWLNLPSRTDAQQSVAAEGIQASFSMCFTGGGYNCVVDGDTIWLKGEKIRIADIDAPETHEPRCTEEKTLGDKATTRLHQLLNSGAVTLQPIDRDRDRYGRLLRVVLVDETSVGDTLVNESLARWYEGGRRPWC
jgi:micrococcal nuclease